MKRSFSLSGKVSDWQRLAFGRGRTMTTLFFQKFQKQPCPFSIAVSFWKLTSHPKRCLKQCIQCLEPRDMLMHMDFTQWETSSSNVWVLSDQAWSLEQLQKSLQKTEQIVFCADVNWLCTYSGMDRDYEHNFIAENSWLLRSHLVSKKKTGQHGLISDNSY